MSQIRIQEMDADVLFVDLLGEHPRTLQWVNASIESRNLQAGVIKRLLVALDSCGKRGGVDWELLPGDEYTEVHTYGGQTYLREVRLTAYSGGGFRSDRAWWLRATMTVSYDPWGVVEYLAGSGSAVVTGSDASVTNFTGASVGNLIMDAWRTSGAANGRVLDLLDVDEPERLELQDWAEVYGPPPAVEPDEPSKDVTPPDPEPPLKEWERLLMEYLPNPDGQQGLPDES